MYNFYYNVMKKIFGESLSIAYMDTDSIHYRIKWPTDPANDMHEWNEQCIRTGQPPVFDLTEFERFKESCRPFAGTVGLFKHEQGDNPMVEAAYASAKMYAYRCEYKENSKTTLKGKGVPTKALERQYKNVEAYKEAILRRNAPPAQFRSIQSRDHIPEHRLITKKCLTADNDKVFLLSPYASRPLGHKQNAAESTSQWAGFELEDEEVVKQIDAVVRQMQTEDVVPENPCRLVDRETADPEDDESDDEAESVESLPNQFSDAFESEGEPF
jgi:hypothetical protein